jgi:hypothetical protein
MGVNLLINQRTEIRLFKTTLKARVVQGTPGYEKWLPGTS